MTGPAEPARGTPDRKAGTVGKTVGGTGMDSGMGAMVGTVVRLQVQRSHLKPRPSGSGHYDPAPLLQVAALEVGERGCIGLVDGDRVLDVHHADHEQTRNVRLVNSVSFLPLSHYARMRARYGPHLVDGVAGENVLLDTPSPWTADDLAGPLWLELDGGPVPVVGAMAAPPCAEFSRFALRRDDLEVDDEVRAALEDLDHGTRGFYLRPTAPGTLVPGARLLRGEP